MMSSGVSGGRVYCVSRLDIAMSHVVLHIERNTCDWFSSDAVISRGHRDHSSMLEPAKQLAGARTEGFGVRDQNIIPLVPPPNCTFT